MRSWQDDSVKGILLSKKSETTVKVLKKVAPFDVTNGGFPRFDPLIQWLLQIRQLKIRALIVPRNFVENMKSG